MNDPLKILIVGCGHMGASHARAYHKLGGEIVGLVARTPGKRRILAQALGGVAEYDDFYGAVDATQPDIVCIATYPETHAPYALYAMQKGAHVFVEKPLATSVELAHSVIAAAQQYKRKIMVGYILRQHPSWQKFIELTQSLGKPLVMRMNLNQQSSGDNWSTHRNLMASLPPIVDCGVHYIDVMCQMTQARPVSVHAIAARLTDEIPKEIDNYGCLQVTFEDGSVGWYEAGWGPMMSNTAHFVKDVIGPKGSVSIVTNSNQHKDSADVNAHTVTDTLLLHHAELNAQGQFVKEDAVMTIPDHPDHDELCLREQQALLAAIKHNHDLTTHWQNAIDSLNIVLAADRSAKTRAVVML